MRKQKIFCIPTGENKCNNMHEGGRVKEDEEKKLKSDFATIPSKMNIFL